MHGTCLNARLTAGNDLTRRSGVIGQLGRSAVELALIEATNVDSRTGLAEVIFAARRWPLLPGCWLLVRARKMVAAMSGRARPPPGWWGARVCQVSWPSSVI